MNDIEKIAVIGAVGTALNVLYQLEDAIRNYNYRVELKGILIDNLRSGSKVGNFNVIGSTKDIPRLLKETNINFIFCLYRMDQMKKRYNLLQSYNIPSERMANFIHPKAYVSSDIKMGKGNVILCNTTIQASVQLGNNNIINSNVIIEHESSICNGNFFSAGVCIGSKVKIGNHCFIGMNSSIRENVQLDGNVFVGMHSLVLENFNNIAVAGIPAKKIKRKQSENQF